MANEKKNQQGDKDAQVTQPDQPNGQQGGGPGALKAPVDPQLTARETQQAAAQQPAAQRLENKAGDVAPHHTQNHEQYAARGDRSAAYNGHKSPHYIEGQGETDLKGKVVTVNNNMNSMIQVQLPMRRDQHGNMHHGKLLVLIPGVNFVNAEDLAEAKKNAVFAAHFNQKIEASPMPEMPLDRLGHKKLVEMTGPIDKENPLSQVQDEDEAIEIVGEMGDLRMIRKALEEETRPKVVEALKSQIKRLEKPATPKTLT